MKSFIAFVFCLLVAVCGCCPDCKGCDPPNYGMMWGPPMQQQSYRAAHTPAVSPSSQTPSSQLPPARQPDIGEVVPLLETTSTGNQVKWIVVKMDNGKFYRAAIVNGYMPAINTAEMTSHYRYKIPYTSVYQQEVAQMGYMNYKKGSAELVARYKKLLNDQNDTYFVSK